MARGRAVATIAGGERFRLWVGRSGRRHVFTRVEAGVDDGDLDGAVVVIAVRTVGGGSRPLWIGEAAQAPIAGPGIDREIFAHWLAETAAERAAVIADLGGAPAAATRPVLALAA